jgi:hypothetical protein
MGVAEEDVCILLEQGALISAAASLLIFVDRNWY